MNWKYPSCFIFIFNFLLQHTKIGPLHHPVTWYKITYTDEQVAQWDLQTKAAALFWKSHCATCSPVYVILYQVTGWCKRPTFFVCWDGKGHQIKRQSIEHNAIVLRLTLKSKLTLVQKHFAVRAASVKIGYLAETMRIGKWTQKGSRITTSPLFISFFFSEKSRKPFRTSALCELVYAWSNSKTILSFETDATFT